MTARVRLGSETAPVSSALPLIVGCLQSPRAKQRVAAALNGHAAVQWCATFADVRALLTTHTSTIAIVVLDLRDSGGAAILSFARAMSLDCPGIGVVAYCPSTAIQDINLCELGAAGVHDILTEGLTDEGHAARSIIFTARRRGAVAMVLAELRRIVPARLQLFAEAVIRNPECAKVAEIAAILAIHRQTPNFWCKKEGYLRPEELLIWCRLLLVAALLELTPRTIESISLDFEYGSAQALRNQLKSYTGLTASAIRAVGWQRVVDMFVGRVAQRRAGYSGAGKTSAEPPSDFGGSVRHGAG